MSDTPTRGRRPGPRIRTIKPELWQEEALGELTRDARLLYLGLTSQADDEGRLRGALALLRSQIYPYDVDLSLDAIDSWLKELQREGLVTRYEHDGKSYLQLPRWLDDQKIDRPTESRFPAPPDDPREPATTTREESRGIAQDQDQDQDQDQTSSVATTDDQREDVEQLCSLLADLVEQNGSKRPTITKRWRDQGRLLLDSDGRPIDEALRLVRWCQADQFWRSNVLSLPKFREKYDQLRLKSDQAAADSNGHSRPGADRLATKFAGMTR